MSQIATDVTGFVTRRFAQVGPLIALCALLSSSCAAADTHSWQCHAPEGTFSANDIAVPESATEFTGEMVIHKANTFSRWNPSAKIAFTDIRADDSACHCNGVVATWYPDNPEFFLVSLVVDGDNIVLGLVPHDKPVTFKLKFAQDGALKLEVGTGVRTGIAPSPKRNNLHLSCSTADVDFRLIDVK